ncbi:MAG: hypothetical protein QNJ45_22595 [Ardenticatenaceae bacterium]|nr:hypothetical protein [Ardenticatenaceae bacterium]
MISELLGILPGCIVFGGLIAVFFYFYRRNQQKRDDQYTQAAAQSGLAQINDSQIVSAIQDQLKNFPFGQRGGQTKVRTAAKVEGGVLLHLLQTRAAPGSDSDHFSALLLDHSAIDPQLNFVLRVRSTLVDNVVNRAVFGQTEEIPLAQWPALAKTYQCLGAPSDQVSNLLQKGLGEWMANEAAADRVRSLEIQNGKILLYQYERSSPDPGRLQGLVDGGKRLINFF